MVNGAGDNRLVLIVDDTQNTRELLVNWLELNSYRTVQAVSGEEALRLAAEYRPDLILLDVMMPRMDGIEVCRRLKSDEKTRDIPIVMVTALNEMADIERAVEAGTDDFLSKPITKLELLTRVKSLLRVRHLKSELERTLAYLGEVEAGELPDE